MAEYNGSVLDETVTLFLTESLYKKEDVKHCTPESFDGFQS